MSRLPLDGARVLDLTQIWAGPLCTELLGGLGAEVIKVESVQRPEPLRAGGAGSGGSAPWETSPLLHTFNLNKLGVTLDLMSPKGRQLFLGLASLSDVVVENFSAGVMDRWGLGYAALRSRRPDVIFLSMPGFGSTGPYASYRALGTTMEAMSGFSWLTGYRGGPPMRCGLNYGDPIAALYGAFAILAALRHRRRTGLGQRLELSQMEALVTLVPDALLQYVMTGRTAERAGNDHPRMAPHGCYPCAGADQWVTIAVATDEEWRALCHVISRCKPSHAVSARRVLSDRMDHEEAKDLPSLASDPRFRDVDARLAHRREIDSLISRWTRRHDSREAMRLLQERGIAAGAVQTAREILEDPQLGSRRAFRTVWHPQAGEKLFRDVPWKFSGTPAGLRSRAPLLGEHNALVLGELLGVSFQEIKALEGEQVIGDRPVAA